MNTFKTFFLMFIMTLLLMLVGRTLGGSQGMMLFFMFGLVTNLITYWFSDKIVLGIYRAKQVPENELPELHEIVSELSAKAGMPKPRIYLVDQETPNAFATGRNPEHAVVCVTRGILELLNKNELRGVIAHELAHIKDRDILIGTVAAVIASAISMIATMVRWGMIFGTARGRDRDEDGGGGLGILVAAIIAPIIAVIVQLAISRTREYEADKVGGLLSGNPEHLALALSKLDSFSHRIPMMNARPATAHMFIINPVTGKSLLTLFSTHPPVKERINRLEALKVLMDKEKYSFPELIK